MLLPTHISSYCIFISPLIYLFFKVFLLFLSNLPLKSKVLRGFRQCVFFFPKFSVQTYRNIFLEDDRSKKILELLAEVGSNKCKTQAIKRVPGAYSYLCASSCL